MPGTIGKLLIIGGGGHAWVVTEAARAQGWRIIGFLDDNDHARLDEETPRLGDLHDASAAHDDPLPHTIIALGSIELRARLIRELSGLFGTVVHPATVVSPSAAIGPGTFVGAGAIIQGRARIGEHCIVNTGAIIEHDCKIGRNVHIAPRACLGGGVTVGDDTLIGIGASIRPHTRIGSGCTIGVGAAVVRDVPDGAKVIGVPAKPAEWWTEDDGS